MKSKDSLILSVLLLGWSSAVPLAGQGREKGCVPFLSLFVFITEGSQPIQLTMLSDAEMKETEGARFKFKPIINAYRNTNFYGPSPGLW